MKRAGKIIGLTLLAAFAVAFYYLYGGTATPDGQNPLVRLSEGNFDQLRSAFNLSQDSVRVVTLLSPT